MEPKNGDLYEVVSWDEGTIGSHAIYDLNKWLSDDSDWDTASKGNYLTPGETLIFLGDVRPGVDHATEFGLFFTRFGRCWVAFAGCVAIDDA